jgi:hypothetical protein
MPRVRLLLLPEIGTGNQQIAELSYRLFKPFSVPVEAILMQDQPCPWALAGAFENYLSASTFRK